MHPESEASLSKIMDRSGRAGRRRGRSASMSAKQTQAYLIARDALRRIRRASSLTAAAHSDPDAGGLSTAPHRSD